MSKTMEIISKFTTLALKRLEKRLILFTKYYEMKDLIIEETTETPGINFLNEEGLLKITGRAYSSDITFFYKELDKWLEEYLTSPKEKTTIELNLDYYNSVFHKLLFNFLKKGLLLPGKGKQLVIKWFYNEGDEDSMDACAHYAKSLDYPIEKIEL